MTDGPEGETFTNGYVLLLYHRDSPTRKNTVGYQPLSLSLVFPSFSPVLNTASFFLSTSLHFLLSTSLLIILYHLSFFYISSPHLQLQSSSYPLLHSFLPSVFYFNSVYSPHLPLSASSMACPLLFTINHSLRIQLRLLPLCPQRPMNQTLIVDTLSQIRLGNC